jgi:hypothetical protein
LLKLGLIESAKTMNISFMETSLHRCLKMHFAQPGARYEVPLGAYRIDVFNPDELVEIQHGSLAAIRRKIETLVVQHRVRVVKPLIAKKTLVRLEDKAGAELSRRLSPKRESLLDIFGELIYLRHIFPHPDLVIDVPLVEMEETRYPGHGRRRRWRENDFQVADQRLVAIQTCCTLASSDDLLALLPPDLPRRWHTGDLAHLAKISRSAAQRIAYCLKHMKAVREVGKRGNAKIYDLPRRAA